MNLLLVLMTRFLPKTNKSTGPDNIPAWMLKKLANSLAAPLTGVFDCSLREGVILTVWKEVS